MNADNRDHLRALLAAYVEVTGLPVTLSPARTWMLRELDRRAIAPDDVRAVLRRVKMHVERGTTGYTDASLDWRNAMQPDKMEERALKLRQEKARKGGAARERAGAAPRPETVPTPDGGTVSRLVAGGEGDEQSIRDAVRVQAAALRARLGGAA